MNSRHELDLPSISAALSLRKLELVEEIRAKRSEIKGAHIGFDSVNAIDGGDAASIDELEALQIAEASRYASELEEIEAALKRIASGAFGKCIECGLPIESDRLRVRPSASRCTSCQKSSEKK